VNDGSRPPVVTALAAVYVAYLVALGGLRFPLTGDEVHFWPTAVEYFGRSPLPSVTALRSYPELNTPLPFVLWGTLEHWWQQGVWLPRALNLLLSFSLAAVIARRSPSAAAALLLCPYYLFVSARIYTDMLAIGCAVAGLWAYLERRHVPSAVLFVLAISSRQLAVAFPLAVAACEMTRAHDRRSPAAVIAAGAAAASLPGWMVFFGGVASPVAIAGQMVATAKLSTVLPRNGLYLLACVGLYFALPVLAIERRRAMRAITVPRLIAVAGVLLVAFVLFPPLGNAGVPTVTMGLLDRTLRALSLPSAVRVAAMFVLGATALIVVSRAPLQWWMTIANAVVMIKAPQAWDKYALPAIVALWFLHSRHETAAAAGVTAVYDRGGAWRSMTGTPRSSSGISPTSHGPS
jgi:hypothetical protein